VSAPTIAGQLAHAAALGLDRLDAHLLLGHILQRERTWLMAHDDDVLDAKLLQRFDTLARRRAAGEPVAYLIGEKEFYGLTLHVTPAVLVPRPDTETLVDWALELMADPSVREVLDLGTGSGAIALALKHRRPAAIVTASDASEAALAVAGVNARRLGLDVEMVAGDWWKAMTGRSFDLVVSNPPYIAEGDAHLSALHHEPELALTSGHDGLDAIRTLVAGAPAHLRHGAWLLFEHGHDQGAAVAELLRGTGFCDIHHRSDLAGLDRCTGGRWP
jgi:release factor glutamine methyltransferase